MRLFAGALFVIGASAVVQKPLAVDNAAQSSAAQLHGGDLDSARPGSPPPQPASLDVLAELRTALHVMQQSWFAVWVGTWPTAIDWTAAVMSTHLVASLATFSKALHSPRTDDDARIEGLENELNRYFGQNSAYYFGEDAFALRYEAYDDMLWVVLGWLESIKTVKLHSGLHYPPGDPFHRSWHGTQFIEAYAHRARVFYELASAGWDTKLCGGGMNWSPHLAPYKNAITNELYIAASVGMYLYFPGDENLSPFSVDGTNSPALEPAVPQDPAYLQAAIDGYDWLANSGMRNRKGLYVDGFHVSDWKGNGTTCDLRDNTVYTYNQGVVLSGLRGLWESTGNETYLRDGHTLARNVIAASGWSLDRDQPAESTAWAGIGRAGILEERCDAAGRCDQTPQTFKGIYFHHLGLFCQPLPLTPLVPGKTFSADKGLASLHRQSCKEYEPWIAHNAGAALATRDRKGRFGTWWGVNISDPIEVPLEDGASDYRNNPSELGNEIWQRHPEMIREPDGSRCLAGCKQTPQDSRAGNLVPAASHNSSDPNERGIGRTVETQGGGVAVLRALWEVSNLA